MGLAHGLLSDNLRDIHISEFGDPIFGEEDICTLNIFYSDLDVTMEDAEIMKFLESKADLGENFPNVALLELLRFLLVFEYPLEQVPSICVLHHNA